MKNAQNFCFSSFNHYFPSKKTVKQNELFSVGATFIFYNLPSKMCIISLSENWRFSTYTEQKNLEMNVKFAEYLSIFPKQFSSDFDKYGLYIPCIYALLQSISTFISFFLCKKIFTTCFQKQTMIFCFTSLLFLFAVSS